MKPDHSRYDRHASGGGSQRGFTLIELLVAMVVSAIAMGAIYSVYASTTKSYVIQRELAHMQQNLRAAMYLMKNDLRNAGRNGLMNGTVGIADVGLYNGDNDNPGGYPGITMTTLTDTDKDGKADSGAQQTVFYRVFDANADGRRELYRLERTPAAPNNSNWELVFDGIEDIGIAYAYDNDSDMDLDRSAASNQVIWAVDTDGRTGLDTNVDANGDGTIDASDGGGSVLGSQIPLSDIRVVRIWLLARSRVAYNDFVDNSTYVVGNKVINMSADTNRRHFRHKLLEGAVAIQNHAWTP
jgi:type IV pilus assembly protein PilW